MLNHNSFNRDFARSQKRFNIMFRLVATIISISFVAIVAFYIFAGVLVFKSAGEIQENGLQGVIQQIWCGAKNKDCLK